MSKKPETVTHEAALKVIRTWASFELDHPDANVLVPRHIVDLCDRALESPQ